MFAYLDPSILKQKSPDSEKTIKIIKELDHYMSFREMIEAAKDKNYPGDKCIYKLNSAIFSDSAS